MNSIQPFLERQAKRRHQFEPKPAPIYMNPRNFTTKPAGPEFPTGPSLAKRLMGELERRETYMPPFKCERLAESEGKRLLDVPVMTIPQVRDLGLPLFSAKEFEPSLFKHWSIILWTRSHGTYRHREIQTFVRDKCHDLPWKITLNFVPLPAVATTEVMFWRVFDAQGRCLKRFDDYSVNMMNGDELRFAYTLNF